ncbi:MAG: U32 family peptidase [Clostridia bacterium]|nr:U32 family peptidase [Clostridia bacterium]
MLEILAPAGNTECADAAIKSGADAIYLGLNAFSARQNAGNFDGTELRALLAKAHFCGVKVYVAMNTLVKDSELDAFEENLLSAWNSGVDAVILQDIFLGKSMHARYPEIVLHLSTQAGVCTADGARLAKECGFSRVILARETPLAEIKKIAEILETEVFVQGALCTCFSGQCYFSSFAGGNSGNRGRCKQPCRKLYAYDRKGNTEKNYALSLSDLCVGEDMQKLIDAGVVSFKIEGRMRRPEYVAAAVRYYRRILDGKADLEGTLSDLKRTYNRGNYTKGLAFGQDKRFLSTAIQGHIGEKVGVVKVVNGKFFVESKFLPKQGDAFKILREGKEVGGASFSKAEGRGFTLFSKTRLKNGDGVFITTDTSVNERVLQGERKGAIVLQLSFQVGERAKVKCGDVEVCSEQPLERAASRPLTREELIACFKKTDGLSVDVDFSEIELSGDIFIPKSGLNALRRAFYQALKKRITGGRQVLHKQFELPVFAGKNQKIAVIADDFKGVKADIAIYKPDDFSAELPQNFLDGKFEKYLYLPSFYQEEDLIKLWQNAKDKIEGIYAENYGQLLFAKEHGWKVFAGTGFNLFNGVALQTLLDYDCVAYYAISKEANMQEASGLVSDKAFVLSSGNIKVMDLCYCPFGKTCSACDKKPVYMLTDENGRVFPVRRYLSAGGACRFEVYNCADLIGQGVPCAGKLLDLTLVSDKEGASKADTDEKQKGIYEKYTSGHLKRGVL